MTEFVDQCRAEWKRLGVPDPLAEEMAHDLAADLREAEAESVSLEVLLGSSAFAPASFAASWAAERGIIPTSTASAEDVGRRPLAIIMFTVVAAITVFVSALLLVTGEPRLSLAATRTTPAGAVSRSVVHGVSAAAPIEWLMLVLGLVALGFAVWLWIGSRRPRPPVAPA